MLDIIVIGGCATDARGVGVGAIIQLIICHKYRTSTNHKLIYMCVVLCPYFAEHPLLSALNRNIFNIWKAVIGLDGSAVHSYLD